MIFRFLFLCDPILIVSRHFSIWRDAEPFTVQIEQTDRQFSCCFETRSKYNLGHDLPMLTRQVQSYIANVINQKAFICHWLGCHRIGPLALVINKLKLTLTGYTAMSTGLFTGFKTSIQFAIESGETLC